MQRDRHVAVWLRMLAEKEVRTTRAAKNLFKAQAAVVAEAFSKGGETAANQVIREGVTDWIKTLTATYAITIRDFVAYTNEQLGVGKKLSFLEYVQAYVAREALKRSTIISDTTKTLMTNVIADGIKNGLGEKVIASNLKEAVGGQLADSRARTIARTEVHNAASFGMQAAAEESKQPLTREWVSVHDGRTREAHVLADGQIRGMNEPFLVGDELIARPGEGSPENSINCRCAIAYNKPQIDVSGDPSGELLDE